MEDGRRRTVVRDPKERAVARGRRNSPESEVGVNLNPSTLNRQPLFLQPATFSLQSHLCRSGGKWCELLIIRLYCRQ